MHYFDTASDSEGSFDELLVFAAQARAAGLPVAIHQRSLPTELSDAKRFELAHLVTDTDPNQDSRLVITSADVVSDARLRHLRGLSRGKPLRCIAYGRFETHQMRIATAARLSYALGTEPDLQDIPALPGLPVPGAPVFAAPALPYRRHVPVAALIFPDIEDEATVRDVRVMARSRGLDVLVITHGKLKDAWIKALGHDVPVWHPGEVLPRALASRFDIAVLMGPPTSWYRVQTLLANVIGAGGTVVDATAERAWSSLPDGVLPASPDLRIIAAWLEREILPARGELSAAMAQSKLRAFFRMPRELLNTLKDGHAPAMSTSRPERGDIVFMPTNGVGLGHARRCSLIAGALEEPERATFAAFPSCLRMLTLAGFDAMPLIGRTPHRAPHENDRVNHVRLHTLARDAAGLVFDGGYVFDSVLRTVADRGLPSVWIRRGLWQSTQNNAVALDRQKIFDRIIVPREAFDELNETSPSGGKVVEVGPIVRPIAQTGTERSDLRKAIFEKAERDAERLVITMLGGGVAADRRAQINAVCSHLEGRSDVLHLLVVWPTAAAEPAWFSHSNSRVIQTHHASALLGAADLFVSAAGYNSFHEVLYGAVPTIFLPQMAGFMDDQRARARSAAERDLALLVEPWETARLCTTIDECLEGRAADLSANLRGLNLPEPGMRAAARHIERVVA